MRKGFKGFMNKVFKVVWSKSKECYVVVPEIAKNNSGKKKVLASVLAGLAVAGAMGGIAPLEAQAGYDTSGSHVNIWADTYPKSNGQNYNVGQNSIVVGYQNTTDDVAGHDGKVAIGAKNTSTNNATTAVGNRNTATGGAATAVGAGNTASGNASVAVGNVNNADAKAAVAIGTYNNVNYTKGSWETTPKKAGEYSTVVGNYSSATGTSASAMGVYTNATGAGSFAAGYNNNAKGQNSVAIGSENTSHVADTVTLGQFNNAKTMGGISIGKNNLTDSTNGGTNFAKTRDENSQIAIGRDNTATHLDTIAIGRDTHATGSGATVIGARADASGDNSIAIGNSGKNSDRVTASGDNSIAIGMRSQATGEAAIAQGGGAQAQGQYGIAVGRYAKASAKETVAMGNEADANIANGVALGDHSVTTTDKGVLGYNPSNPHERKYKPLKGNVQTATTAAVSIGNGETLTRQLTGLAAGTADTDAVNVAQLKNVGVAVTGNTGSSDFLADGGKLNVIGEGRVSTVAAHDGDKDSRITVGFDDKGMVKAGKNVKVDEVTVNGKTTYTIHAADAAAKYDFLTNAKANGGKLDGTATPTKVESGTTVSYAAGKNLTVKQDINQSAGEQTYTYSLNKDLKEITSITNNGGTTMNFGPNNISITGGNLDLGDHNITNLKSGGDVENNAANIGDVTRISKANDLHIAPTAGTNNNVAEYTVDGNKKVTLTYQDGNGKTVNGPKAVIDLSGLKTGDMSSFNVKSTATEGTVARGSQGQQAIRDGKTVEMQAGKNMTIKQTNNNGNAAVEFSLNKNVDLTPDGSLTIGDTNITDNGLTINNGPSITKTGINAGDLKITNVKAGVNDNDAVNVSQLKQVRADEHHIKPGEYAVDANGKVTMTYVDGNNKDVANETAVITGIAKQDLSNINKGGETVIQNLAKKSIDMENGKNTTASHRDVNGVKTFKVDVEGDLTDITSITNKDGDGKVVFGGNQTVNVAGDHNINLNAKVGDITGLTNVTLDAPDFAKKGRAATEEQLNIVNNGFNNTVGLTGNTGATELQKLNKQGGLSFGVVGANNGEYIKTTASGSNVVADLSDSAKNKLNSTVVVEGKNAAKVTSNVIQNADGSTKTVYTVDVNNVKPTAASTEKVQAKADVAGSSDKNIAKVAPKAGENFGDAGATYEVNVSRNDVKDAAREAVTVNTTNSKNNPITVTPVQDETNHNTTYQVTFDGNKAATQIPLTYKANGQNAQTVTLDKGLNFTNGRNTTASVDAEGVVKYDVNKDLVDIHSISNTTNGPKMEFGPNSINVTGGPINMGDLNITNLKSGGDVNNNAANIGDVKRISKANDLHIAPTSSDRQGETTTSYAYDAASKSVTLKYNDGNGANQAGTVAKIDLSGLADQIKDGYSFSTDAKGNVVGNHAVTAVGNGKTVSYAAGDNLTVKQDIDATTGEHTYTYALSNDIKVGNDGKDGKPGVDGKIGVNGKDGSSVVINGKDGSIGLNGKDGKDGLTMKAKDGQPGVNGKDGITRIVYEDNSKNTHEVATLDDGMKYAGDDAQGADKSKVIAKKLNETMDVVGGADKSKLTDNNIGVNNVDGKLKVQLSKEVKLTPSGSLTIGDTVVNNGGLTISGGPSVLKTGINAGNLNITNVKAGVNDTDAVNVKQLKDARTVVTSNDNSVTVNKTENGNQVTYDLHVAPGAAQSVWNVKSTGNTTTDSETAAKTISDGKTVEMVAGKNLTVKQTSNNDGAKVEFDLANDIKIGNDGKDGKDGVDGKIGVNGKDGSSVVINGKDGSIGLNGKDGKDGLTMKGEKGQPGLNGKDGITRIVYEDNNHDKHEVATLDDGLNFTGNNTDTVNKQKLNSLVKVQGEGVDKTTSASFKSASGNINVKADGTDTLEVQLNKDLKNITTIKNDGPATLTIGGNEFKFSGGNVNMGDNNITNLKSGGDVINNAANIGDVKRISKENDIHIKDKTYTVNADKTVTLEYVDGNDNAVSKTAKIDLSNLPTGDKAAVESVVKKSAATGDTNIADITVADGKQTGDANAKYEVNVSRNAVKDAAREAVTVNTTNSKNNPITVTPVQDETNHNTTYTVTFDGNKAATQIPLTYKANGQNAQTVTLDKGLNFTNGSNTTASVAADGVVKYDLNNNIDLTPNGSLKIGDTILNNGGLTITGGPSVTKTGINAGGLNITNVKAGVNDNDAVNVKQLKDARTVVTSNDNSVTVNKTENGNQVTYDLHVAPGAAQSVWNVKSTGNTTADSETAAKTISDGKTVEMAAGKNLTVKQTSNNDGAKVEFDLANDIKIGNDGKDGKDGIDGKIGVNGKDGSSVVINGKDGSIGLNGKDGKDGLTMKAKDGQPGVNGKDGITRIVYEDNSKNTHEVATLDDGMKYAGDDAQGADKSKVIAKKLNETMDVVGGADKSKLTDNNIGVNNVDGKLKVQLSKEVNLTPSGSLTIGDTVVNNNGLTISGGPSITKTGINAGNKTIVNVDAGVNDTDAVNVAQLKKAKTEVKAGNNVTVDTTYGNDGHTIYTVNANDVALGDAVLKYSANGTNTQSVKLSQGLNFVDGNYTSASVDANGQVKYDVTIGKVKDGVDGKPGVDGKDGIATVKTVVDTINNSGWKGDVTGNTVNNHAATIVKPGTTVNFGAGKNLTVEQIVDQVTGDHTYNYALSDDIKVGHDGKDGKPGVDGKIGVNGKDGSAVVINGKDGSIGLNGKDGKDGLTIRGEKGQDGVDGKNGTNGITRIVYEDNSKNTHEVATLDDGMKYAGDDAQGTDKSKVIAKKLNQTMDIVGGANSTKLTDNNIGVNNVDGKLKVQLAQNIDLTPAGSLTIGDTVVNNGGLTISGGPSIIKTGINAGNLNITNVKAGVNDTDAVNVKQLKDARTVVTSNDNSVTVNKTENGNQVTYDLHVAPGAAQSVWNVKSTGNTTADSETAAKTISDGKTVEMAAGKNLTVKQTSNNDGAKVEFDLANDIKIGNDGKDGKDGVDGKIGVNGKDGSSVVINGKDGSIGLNGKDGKDGLTMKGEKGQPGLNGKDGITRIVYEDNNHDKHEVATLDDGLNFTGNNTDTVNKQKLNSLVKVQGEGVDKTTSASFKSASGNINVKADGTDTLEVQLNKDLKNITTIKNDGPATLTIGGNEFKFDGGNVNMGGNNITNLKSGIVNNNSTDDTNGANIGDVKTISKANDLHIAPTTSNRTGETTATYAYNTADKSVTLKYNDGNGATQTGTIAKIDLSGLADQIKDGYSFSTDAKGNVVGNHAVTAVGNGKTVSYAAGDNLTIAQNIDNATGEQTYTYALSNDIKIGKDGKDGVDGKIGVNGKDGSSVVINGKDGSIGLNGKDGKDGLTMKGEKGQPGLNGKDGITRIVYEDNNHDKHEVATLDDGLNFTGNNTDTVNKQKLNSLVKVQGEGVDKTTSASFKSASGNINVKADGTDTLEVQLNKDLNNINTIKNGGPATFTIGGNEFKFDGGNVNMGGNNITNLKSGIVNNNSTDDTNGANIGDVKTISKANDIHVKDTRYTVNADKTVTLEYVDGNDKKINKTAVIDLSNLPTGGNAITYKANNQNAQTVSLDKGLNFIDGNYTKASVDADGIVKYDVTIGKVKDGVDGKPGVDGNDGIATVKTVVDTINNSGWKGDVTGNTVGNHTATIVKPGTTVNFGAGKNVTVEQIVNAVTGDHTYNYALSDDIKVGNDGKDGKPGVDGKIGVNGKDGSAVVINGKDGSIGLNGKDGKDGLTFKGANGQDGVDGKNGTNGMTRIVYEDSNNNKHEVATTDDGLKFTGNNESVVNKNKLNSTVKVKGEGVTEEQEKTFESAAGNIAVTADGNDTLNIRLNKNIKGIDSIQTKEIHLGTPDNYTTIKKDGDRIKYGDKTFANTDDIWTIQANGTDVPANGGKVNVKGADGITVSKSANGEMTISGAGLGTMNSFNVKSTGNTTADSETAAKSITDGKTVEFSGGNNLSVKQTNTADGAKVEFALNNKIDLTDKGSVTIGDTKITDGGLVINNGPSVTKDGINAGNKQITNVDDGVNDTDAVNVRQLKAAKTNLTDGQNTKVTGDGSKNNPYKVNVEGDLNKITSITNKEGDGKLEFKGDQVVNVAGDNTIKLDGKTGDITGLTNKTLDSADFATKGRAATEEQLKLVQQEAAKKSTEKVQAKADANNIAKVAPKAGDTFGAAGATYEVSVDKNDVKDAAREAVTVTGDNKAITVDVQPNATNHTTNYQVNFNGKEAAKQIPLTYKENGGNARTVMLSDGLDFSNGVNTTAHTDAKGKVSFDVKGDLTNITSISNNSNGPKMSFGGDSINITGGSLSLGDNFIHNVKAGEKNTDAVNVSQLKAAKTEVEAGRNVTVEHRLGENGQDIYKVNAEAAADPRVDQLGEEIGHVGAQSAALSALKPIQYDPMEPTQIMAGYGNYRGNSALALGVAHYKNESTMFHAGVSWAGGNGHMMANAGVTWKVGNKDSEAAVADHYRKGPISSTYAMQTEVASMKAQNAGLKGEVSDLKAENEQIKAQNAGLQSEVDQLKAQMAAMMAKLGM